MSAADPVRVLAVVGTASEAAALAPVVRCLRADARFSTGLVAGGPHRELADRVLEAFELTAQRLPGTLRLAGSRSPLAERPHWVLVHGGGAGAHAAALLACNAGVRVAHLGAGLPAPTSGAPLAEQSRRRALAQLASLHLAPDESAAAALRAAAVPERTLRVVGRPHVDALLEVHRRARACRAEDFATELGPLLAALLDDWGGRLVLVAPRGGADRGGFAAELCAATRAAAARHPDWMIVWPVHPEPAVHARVHEQLRSVGNAVLCEPLSFAAFAWLLGRCDALVTDSEALWEAAAALGRPALALGARTDPTRQARVRAVAPRAEAVLRSLDALLLDHALYADVARPAPAACGDAAARVVAALATSSREIRAEVSA